MRPAVMDQAPVMDRVPAFRQIHPNVHRGLRSESLSQQDPNPQFTAVTGGVSIRRTPKFVTRNCNLCAE